ncbi:MAG: VCBS repeat-containing protein [candidate division WOR-3 bacterium]|nr:VCBS repeat-containing protein [candidate division WOR-3 bacterium]MCX7836669.1 VCBS repeat-containing protein [candidate division WOR-3 bacterium]MDW8113690.1 VCBS repeat-containing protein [candidate division WOR-3 bacterium]
MIALIFNLIFVIPLPNSPSWLSIDNDYSTGGGFWDIDNNSYIDFVTSNGNDMAENQNGIYFNYYGELERTCSWRSQDYGYFGHLYLGDVNNDGNFDLAVSYLGIGNISGKIRIYLNNGQGLNPLPYWYSSENLHSFDCCLGDVDLDGDLDLAVACGDVYNNINEPARIYRNNNGIFDTIPFWLSSDPSPSDAIRFVDINNDGYLDLIVGHRRRINVYISNNGILPQNPTIRFSVAGWVLRMAVGDYNNDGYYDLAVASNGQLSGDRSRILIYRNNLGVLDTVPIYTLLTNTRYSSVVAFGDLQGDGYLELACGGWWESVCVFENHHGSYSQTPEWSYNWGTNLVCENIMFGCIRNDHLRDTTEIKIGNGERKLFNVKKIPLQRLNSVYLNGRRLSFEEFSFDYLTGYFTFRETPRIGDTILINYTYSPFCDLGITNWDRSRGNLLFLNTTSSGIVLSEKKEIDKNYKDIYNIFGQKVESTEKKKGVYFINKRKIVKIK